LDSKNSVDFKSLLIDARVVAQDFLKNSLKNQFYEEKNTTLNGQVFSTSYLDLQKFGQCVLEQLAAQGRIEPPYKIEVITFEFKNETLGLTEYPKEDGEKKFRISIEKSLNTCWTRLIVIKELCQVYFDYEKKPPFFRINEMDKQISDLVSKHKCLIEKPDIFSLKVTDGNYSEFLAFYMALYLVFPESQYSTFNQLVEMAYDETLEPKLYDIAYIYRMPEYIVKLFHKKLAPFYHHLVTEGSSFASL